MQLQHIPDSWTIEKTDFYTFVYDDSNVKRCGAKARSGKPCRNDKLYPNGRCRMHNGQASINSTGENNPAYRDGQHTQSAMRYEKQMPDRLKEMYREYGENEGDLNNLDPNIVILDTRMSELIGRLERGDYANNYYRLKTVYNDMMKAEALSDEIEFQTKLYELGELIETGLDDYQLWKEIVDLNDRRSKMVERKINILTKASMAVSLEDYVQTLRMIEIAYNETINLPTEIERRRAFADKLDKLMLPGNE